jgi:hypothetical protein
MYQRRSSRSGKCRKTVWHDLRKHTHAIDPGTNSTAKDQFGGYARCLSGVAISFFGQSLEPKIGKLRWSGCLEKTIT